MAIFLEKAEINNVKLRKARSKAPTISFDLTYVKRIIYIGDSKI